MVKIMSSSLSPQFKYMIFHIFSGIFSLVEKCIADVCIIPVFKFRAYIEFERPRIMDRGLESNSIVPAVYKAIKMRSESIS